MKSSNEPKPMNPDDFEKRLKQSPLRQVPADWRAEILGAARAAAKKPEEPQVSIWLTIQSWVASGLELKPKALAGLAAIWIAIFALHFSTHDDSGLVVSRTPVSKQEMAEVREQRMLFAQLVGLKETHDAEPPRQSLPRPRSEGRPNIVLV